MHVQVRDRFVVTRDGTAHVLVVRVTCPAALPAPAIPTKD